MAGSRLLDTNAIAALLEEDHSIQQLTSGLDLFIPVTALGEFYFGIYKSTRVEANLKKLQEFMTGKVVLMCDTAIAERYGQIKYALRVKGRPIPENDIWIAAIALQHQLILVTRDQHFNHIDGLKVEAW